MNDETQYQPPPQTDTGEDGGDPSAERTPTESMNLQDTVLGDFRILRRIGKGGMAEVYLAEQVSLQRQVAIKVLRADLVESKDDSLIKRFEQEATSAGKLIHPNIAQIYIVGEQNGVHYIAQEYVQGPNLKDYVRKKGPADLGFALRIMRQAAAALECAGEAGIVHRDIKPENIMLTRKGEVKVADFGLAQLSTNKEGVNLTQVGMTMGTPLYMSPEQINGSKLDARSDIYSLGVTCFYMLTGRPPFEGETPLSIAVKHLNEEPPRLSQFRSDLPPVLIDLVRRMMAKSPNDRFGSAAELSSEIRRIVRKLRDRPDGKETSPESYAAPRPPGSGQLLRQVFIFLACAVPVFLLSAGIGWMLRTPDPLATQAPPDKRPGIPVQDTAQQQYLYAAELGGTVDAWRAVIDNFPNDPEYTYRAKAALIVAYLQNNQRAEAEEIVDDFVSHGGNNDTYRAIGAAGQALLAFLDEDDETALRKIQSLERNRVPLELRDFVDEIEQKVQERRRKNLLGGGARG